VLLTACGTDTVGGPLAEECGNSSYSTAPAKTNQIVAFGLWLPGTQGPEADMRSVEPAVSDQANGLQLRYAGVEPNSGCNVGSGYGWPPKRLQGATSSRSMASVSQSE
jgi:hypothetical protein